MSQTTQSIRMAGDGTSRTFWRAALVAALVAAVMIAGVALVALNGAGALDTPADPPSRAAADSRLDDYGLRHPVTPAVNREDDYGLRHPVTPAVNREDDYGLRHPAPFGGTTADSGE